MSQKNLKVDANNDQRRLDNYLIYKFPNLPKSKIYSMIRKGETRINSKRCKAQTKISLGDEIRLPPYLESEKRDNNFKNLPPKIEKLIKNAIIFDVPSDPYPLHRTFAAPFAHTARSFFLVY